METEKSTEKSKAEQRTMNEGYNEKDMDLNVNRKQGDLQNMQRALPAGMQVQQGKKISVYQAKKTDETVLLEKRS